MLLGRYVEDPIDEDPLRIGATGCTYCTVRTEILVDTRNLLILGVKIDDKLTPHTVRNRSEWRSRMIVSDEPLMQFSNLDPFPKSSMIEDSTQLARGHTT